MPPKKKQIIGSEDDQIIQKLEKNRKKIICERLLYFFKVNYSTFWTQLPAMIIDFEQKICFKNFQR